MVFFRIFIFRYVFLSLILVFFLSLNIINAGDKRKDRDIDFEEFIMKMKKKYASLDEEEKYIFLMNYNFATYKDQGILNSTVDRMRQFTDNNIVNSFPLVSTAVYTLPLFIGSYKLSKIVFSRIFAFFKNSSPEEENKSAFVRAVSGFSAIVFSLAFNPQDPRNLFSALRTYNYQRNLKKLAKKDLRVYQQIENEKFKNIKLFEKVNVE